MVSIKISLLFGAIVLAVILMPDSVAAGPVKHPEKENVAELTEGKPANSLALQKPTRHKRNAVAHYQSLPEFWAWYKYYVDTHNQEGIERLDQLYLQHKQQFEGDFSHKHHLNHLSEVYKACAKSDDPDCIPEYTSKAAAMVAMPVALKQTPVNVCNPYVDPYCFFTVGLQAADTEIPYPAPVSVKSPGPVLFPSPMKTSSGFHFYTPAVKPFISDEMRAELLRICSPSDTECLQYHLRAAYGYRPALTQMPFYAHLGCDPIKDPYCRYSLLENTPSGLRHVYPQCNPYVDPLCVSNIAQASQSAEEAPKKLYCNPLFEKGCNPLTANRLGSFKAPVTHYVAQHKPTSLHMPECHPYDPNCSNFSPPASMEASKNEQDGILLPHPDCDPEIDYNCRLRRAKPRDNQNTAEKPKDELASEDNARNINAASLNQVPKFEDFLREYVGQYKK